METQWVKISVRLIILSAGIKFKCLVCVIVVIWILVNVLSFGRLVLSEDVALVHLYALSAFCNFSWKGLTSPDRDVTWLYLTHTTL